MTTALNVGRGDLDPRRCPEHYCDQQQTSQPTRDTDVVTGQQCTVEQGTALHG